MNFWNKALGTPVARQAPPPAQYPQPGSGYQPPQQFQGLAVPTQNVQQNDQRAQFYSQGYNDKCTPDWVKSQPTEHCPSCGGVNFARSGGGEGTYGQLRMTKAGPTEYGRCFDCNFTLNGGSTTSAAQLLNSSGGSNGGAVQATRQPHGMKNFSEIRISR